VACLSWPDVPWQPGTFDAIGLLLASAVLLWIPTHIHGPLASVTRKTTGTQTFPRSLALRGPVTRILISLSSVGAGVAVTVCRPGHWYVLGLPAFSCCSQHWALGVSGGQRCPPIAPAQLRFVQICIILHAIIDALGRCGDSLHGGAFHAMPRPVSCCNIHSPTSPGIRSRR